MMDRLQSGRRLDLFGWRGIRRNPAYPLFVSIYSLIDLSSEVWLLAKGREYEKNQEQENKAGGHTHLLRQARAEFYTRRRK